MFKNELIQILQEAMCAAFPELDQIPELRLDYPENPDHGDYACAIALQLAKPLRKSPREVAERIVENLKKPKWVHAVELAGPGYINVFIAPSALADMLKTILKNPSDFGKNQSGKGQRIMIEYSQPNTNKPMHIGHMRNNFLGMAVTRILAANGYEAIPVNYVGDIGVHITKSMLGYLKWGRNTSPESMGVKGDYFVGKYYQQFETELGKNPALKDEAQEMVKKWEAEDPEVRALWKRMNDWVYEGWKVSYERQGCHFEHWFYESEYNESGKAVANEALEKGVAERADNGAIIAKLEAHGLPDKVIMRGDGTSIYATKDLKLAEESFERFSLDGRVYVVASQQELYLKQIFKILELMGHEYAKKCYHLSYGIVSLPEGMMSSRRGTVIYADDLMSEVHELAYNEVKMRHESEPEEWLHESAERIMVGALKYAILKVDPLQNITYDPAASLDFQGHTGPYLQYTHARLKSILKKANVSEGAGPRDDHPLAEAVSPETFTPAELSLLRILHRYPETVASVLHGYRLHTLANFLYELAQHTNRFYVENSVLEAPIPELRIARLQLMAATAAVLKNGLAILGIEAPERM